MTFMTAATRAPLTSKRQSPSPSKTYKKVERRGHPNVYREDGQIIIKCIMSITILAKAPFVNDPKNKGITLVPN